MARHRQICLARCFQQRFTTFKKKNTTSTFKSKDCIFGRMGNYTSLSMIYKVQDNCIEGYEGNELVSLLYITDPVARSKYILQLHQSGELDART